MLCFETISNFLIFSFTETALFSDISLEIYGVKLSMYGCSQGVSQSQALFLCLPVCLSAYLHLALSLSLSFSSETELLPAPFVSGTAPLDDRKSGNSVKYCKCWFDSEMPFTKPLLQFRNFFRFWKNWRGRKWIRLCAHSIRDSHFKSQTKIWSRLQQPMRVGNSSDTVVP